MKIAISGTHCSGKTTLIEELYGALSTYEVVDEPYYLLEAEGHQFADRPSVEDFELQLDCSVKSIVGSGRNCLFERCPIDFLAYLFTHRDFTGFDVANWLPRVRRAVGQLDLIVFVPVEKPDRMPVPGSEDAGLRSRVDEQLRPFLSDNPWRFDVTVLEVAGTSRERARRVLTHLGSLGA